MASSIAKFSRFYYISCVGKAGWVLIYYKASLKVCIEDIAKSITPNDNIEAVSLYITSHSLLFILIYMHAKEKYKTFFESLENIMSLNI